MPEVLPRLLSRTRSFFSTSSIRFHTSTADSPSSCLRSKKSALLCWTFLSGVKCSLNNVYSLYNGSELGSLSLTVLVISVTAFWPPIAHRNISFISVSNCSRYCGSISLLFVIFERSRSLVIFMYCTNFRHHMFALVKSCFSSVGMVSFCVHVRSLVLFSVSFGNG